MERKEVLFSTILSGAVYGIDCQLVSVEVDLSKGLPCFVMVGMLGSEVKEAGERVRIALKNSGILIPPMHIAVNISPGNLRKEGTGFDLPITVGVLEAMGKLPAGCSSGMMLVGEISLDGGIRPVRGVLPLVNCARKSGVRCCLVPMENLSEAAAVKGMKAVGVENLQQVISYLNLNRKEQDAFCTRLEQKEGAENEKQKKKQQSKVDFEQIIGQENVRQGALIAAAGFHHLLIVGPPGAGKTMIARRLPTILPPLSAEESLEVSSIHSISGALSGEEPLLKLRPFLSPHHTISPQALSGGGRIPKPGVISLAHRGVLFLDELPEFKRQTLDLLRQPLEDKTIQIARTGGVFTYPADIMLCGAMNPCPCGYYPDRNRCRCTPSEIHQYLSHISGPVLDRIDLFVAAARVSVKQLQSAKKGESSAAMRKKVLMARRAQEKRYQGSGFCFNADLPAGQIEEYCFLGAEERKMLERLYVRMDLSARAYHRMLKVARTIADLAQSERVRVEHIAQAAGYRRMELFEGEG